MAKFVIAGTVAEQPVVLALEASNREPGMRGEFNVVATLPSGRKVKILGLEQKTDGRVIAFRWGGYNSDPEVKKFFAINDLSGRISDLFND